MNLDKNKIVLDIDRANLHSQRWIGNLHVAHGCATHPAGLLHYVLIYVSCFLDCVREGHT